MKEFVQGLITFYYNKKLLTTCTNIHIYTIFYNKICVK